MLYVSTCVGVLLCVSIFGVCELVRSWDWAGKLVARSVRNQSAVRVC